MEDQNMTEMMQEQVAKIDNEFLAMFDTHKNREYNKLIAQCEEQGLTEEQIVTQKEIMDIISTCISSMLDTLKNREVDDINYVMSTMDTLLSGRPLTQLDGTDDEWVDITHKIDPSQLGEFELADGSGRTVVVESLQENARFRAIRRFNNDNQFAFRADAVIYRNVATGNDELHASSARFIKFPYYPGASVMQFFTPSMKENENGEMVESEQGVIVKTIGNTDPNLIGTLHPNGWDEYVPDAVANSNKHECENCECGGDCQCDKED